MKLSNDLLTSGVVPNKNANGRVCTLKFKVAPLNTYIDHVQQEATPPKVILSYGKGVDSTYILERLIACPELRVLPNGETFDLSELMVLTTHVGDEFGDTYDAVDAHVMPLLRQHNIRTVQICRAGPKKEDGILVLEDSRQPSRMLHDLVPFRLSDEMDRGGTVPQKRAGRRDCTIKFKGEVLDALKEAIDPTKSSWVIIGYNADEKKRAERGLEYAQEGRRHWYAGITWDAGREQMEAHLTERFGIVWPKSCCTFCPFAGGKLSHMRRLRGHVPEALQALLIERVALSLNPRQALYDGRTLHLSCERDGQDETLAAFEAHLDSEVWAVYRVRRIMTAKGRALRAVEIIDGDMNRQQAIAELATQGDVVLEDHVPRVWKQARVEGEYPSCEHFIVACPQHPVEKARSWDRFNERWEELTGETFQYVAYVYASQDEANEVDTDSPTDDRVADAVQGDQEQDADDGRGRQDDDRQGTTPAVAVPAIFEPCPYCGDRPDVEVWGSEFLPLACCERMQAELDVCDADDLLEVLQLRDLVGARGVADVRGQFLVDYRLRCRVLQGSTDWQTALRFWSYHHRHCDRPPRGWKFGVGCFNGDRLIGVGHLGRPTSRVLQARGFLEVGRVCVDAAGLHRNAGSMILGAIRRECRQRYGSGRALVSYTLATESGATLRAAGWQRSAELRPRRNRQGELTPARVRWEVAI